mgnify:CR=1 FL=1
MFLFIFESIGTSELILIGIIALIFLGPRKLPELARILGKIMADLRNTTNEFKDTWEREVNFEEETKAFRIDDIDEKTEPRKTPPALEKAAISAPAVKEIDASRFDDAIPAGENGSKAQSSPEKEPSDSSLSEKRDWL